MYIEGYYGEVEVQDRVYRASMYANNEAESIVGKIDTPNEEDPLIDKDWDFLFEDTNLCAELWRIRGSVKHSSKRTDS